VFWWQSFNILLIYLDAHLITRVYHALIVLSSTLCFVIMMNTNKDVVDQSPEIGGENSMNVPNGTKERTHFTSLAAYYLTIIYWYYVGALFGDQVLGGEKLGGQTYWLYIFLLILIQIILLDMMKNLIENQCDVGLVIALALCLFALYWSRVSAEILIYHAVFLVMITFYTLMFPSCNTCEISITSG
jgi:hypothetical protein